MTNVNTAFRPEQGFRFANSFALSAAAPAPLARALGLGRLAFGLCGGMCYAALDYFHAGRPLPEVAEPPGAGAPLYRYLWARQWDSLGGPLGLLRIVRWMLRGDEAVARLTARREFPRLAALLDAGQPAVLLLVRAGGLSDPTQNHQAVAWGYDLDEATGRASIRLYDPNHPPRHPAAPAPRIELDLGVPEPAADARFAPPIQSTGEGLRGFYVLAYRAKTTALPAE